MPDHDNRHNQQRDLYQSQSSAYRFTHGIAYRSAYRFAQSRVFGVILAVLIMVIVPVIGFALRNNAAVMDAETAVLRSLMQAPHWMQLVSAGIAISFSTLGCIAFLIIGATVDVFVLRRGMKLRYSPGAESNQHAVRARGTGSIANAEGVANITGVANTTSIAHIVLRDIVIAILPMAYIMAVKWLVMRPRPITSVGSAYLPKDPSFPSGHTAVATCVAILTVLITGHLAHTHTLQSAVCTQNQSDELHVQSDTQYLQPKALHLQSKTMQLHHVQLHSKLIWTLRGIGIAIIVIVAFSRMILGVHYPTDVLVAALTYAGLACAVGCMWRG